MTVVVGELQPSYITVDPTTFVTGADFTGHVHAGGLDLDAGTNSTPPNTDRIRWIRAADGAVVANAQSFSGGGEEFVSLQAQAAAPGDLAVATLDAFDDTFNHICELKVQESARGVPPASSNILATALNTQITLIDGAGRSSLLQLAAGVSATAIAFGIGVCVWPGASFASNATAINHGLGRIPSIVFVSNIGGMSDGQGQAAIFAAIDNSLWTNTQFTVNGKIGGQYYTPGAAVQAKFGWVAIG